MNDRVAEIKAGHTIEGVLRARGIELKKGMCCCPFHKDKSPSFSVKNGRWTCFAGCGGGDVVELLAKFEGKTSREYLRDLGATEKDAAHHPQTNGNGHAAASKSRVKKVDGSAEVKRQAVAYYPYHDAKGVEVYQSVRFEPKGFSQRRVMPDGGYTWSMDGVERVPYRLPEVLKAREVWITEGEKDVATLESLGKVATCNVGGAGKWDASWSPYFKGKHIVLCGDNDEPGQKHMDAVAAALKSVANSIIRVTVPEPHKDISDAVEGMSDGEANEVIDRMVKDCAKDPWAIVDLVDFIAEQEECAQPLQIVENFIEKGTKVIFGGASKSKKTWSMLDLGLSVAFGKRFWGMATARVKVLHVDFELKPKKLADRVKAIAQAKGIEIEPRWLFPLSLRGQMTNPDAVLVKIKEKALEVGAGLITIDPAYKFLAGKEENGAGDIAMFLNKLEAVVVATDAAVIIANHFSKGNQAAKDPMDRIAGSGVWARDADTLFVMTAHQEDDCLTVSPVLRNFQELPEFVVRWNYPLMERAEGLDPKALKQPRAHNAGTAMENAEELLDLIRTHPLRYGDFEKVAFDQLGIKESTFKKYFGLLKKEKKIEVFQGVWRVGL